MTVFTDRNVLTRLSSPVAIRFVYSSTFTKRSLNLVTNLGTACGNTVISV